MSENKWNYRDKLRRALREVDDNLDGLLEVIDGNLVSEVSITIKTVLGDEAAVNYELKTDNYLLQNYGKNFSEKKLKNPLWRNM